MKRRKEPPPIVDKMKQETATSTRAAVSDEAIRLAAKLRAAFSQSHHVLQFTGVGAQEGVSHVTSQVACALAQIDQSPVLLLDTNLRSPAVHQAFGTALQPGLSDLLDNRAALADVIHATAVPGLSVLPAGGGQSDSVQLFSSAAWSELVQTMRERFRFVLMDSAPILQFADSTLLAPRADGVVIVVAAGQRHRAELLEARQLLERLKATVVGVVLARKGF
ncbi:MAG TPA: CpsD/CapB family tyrosine-protein kinase, partial [Terriglobales bacterium]